MIQKIGSELKSYFINWKAFFLAFSYVSYTLTISHDRYSLISHTKDDLTARTYTYILCETGKQKM